MKDAGVVPQTGFFNGLTRMGLRLGLAEMQELYNRLAAHLDWLFELGTRRLRATFATTTSARSWTTRCVLRC